MAKMAAAESSQERGLKDYQVRMRVTDANEQRAGLAEVINAALADDEGNRLAAVLAKPGLA